VLDLLYGHFHEMTYETVLAVFEGGVAGPCHGVVVFSLLAVSEGVCHIISGRVAPFSCSQRAIFCSVSTELPAPSCYRTLSDYTV
jgi:hypothetical protein